MPLELFHPLTQRWFASRFAAPTDAQRQGWPAIAAGRHTLIAAPTGSGKTLAAFLVCLDRLLREHLEGGLENRIETVYVSPLRALSNDIERNLQQPLAELRLLCEQEGLPPPPIRTVVRTGDTPASQRAAMLRRPPHLVVTTPESLYLLLTSPRGRELLRTVRTVIVDEIHALARDKRGSHLALSLERLAALCERPPVRIGLSATQRPIEAIARFLVGVDSPGGAASGLGVASGVAGAPGVCVAAPSPAAEAEGTTVAGSSPGFASQTQGTPTPVTPTPGAPTPCTPTYGDAPSTSTLFAARRPAAADGPPPDCVIVDAGHVRERDLRVVTPPSDLQAVCSHEQWGEVYEELRELITSHRSTLVFVNTRRLAERVAHRLTEMLGEGAVASHHGSLSKDIRLAAEQKLKAGELRAIVATSSLEMGIDIGYIDLVCQIGSPRSIAAFLQRVGRSGHALGAVPCGRLFPLTRDELLECLALVRAVRRGELDRIEIPQAPLDILAQQIVAETACQEWDEERLFELFRRAWPYRDLSRADYDAVLTLLDEGFLRAGRRGAWIHRDRLQRKLRARRGARLAALTNGGAIPDTNQYRVVTEEQQTFIGTVDEDFAVESLAGDVFLLGNSSWRIRYVRGNDVVVVDAEGLPPTIPFWFGEGPGRTPELSAELSRLRQDLAAAVRGAATCRTGLQARLPAGLDTSCLPPHGVPHELTESAGSLVDGPGDPSYTALLVDGPGEPSCGAPAWLQEECGADEHAAAQALAYVAAQLAAVDAIPTTDELLFERFFDESGGMQLVIHAPLGSRITRAWGLAMRKRFCRSFDFELQAAATDNGIVLSLGPQHSFPLESMFTLLRSDIARHLLEQAVLAAPMFGVRWRWNASRALALLRWANGKKTPPHLQRFRSDDLLAAAFPEVSGCFENHHGDTEIPDHPLVQQTLHDCLTEAMDVDRWLGVLREIEAGRLKLTARDTREPSPFSHELLNANPYAFLDDAPLEERRTRAVSVRRTLSPEAASDLAWLDPEAIAQVREEAWPVVRDADELHEVLEDFVLVTDEEAAPWAASREALVQAGRAVRVELPPHNGTGAAGFWTAAEHQPLVRAVFPAAALTPEVPLPPELVREWSKSEGWVKLLRGRMERTGPVTAAALAAKLRLDAAAVTSALEALEGEGVVLRGRFTPDLPAGETQWCDRRLLARIHRLTLGGLRKRIQPVAAHDYLRYLARRHGLDGGPSWSGPAAVREALEKLQGFEAPAGVWEGRLLAARIADYSPAWLDQLFLAGDAAWGRLRRPRRREDETAGGAMTRSMPLSLMLREDVAWLLPPDRRLTPVKLRGAAAEACEALRARGALFFRELAAAARLTPARLEDALRELAAAGLAACDGFAAVRALAAPVRKSGRVRRPQAAASPVGRWSCFPAVDEPVPPKERIARWADLLLRRYGVLFRELLLRESAAPSWGEIVSELRRRELRGELRGGRFVAGVGSEQYAAESEIEALRRVRDEPPTGKWTVLSAADPLNLCGLVGEGPRVPANHRNTLILRDGRWAAVRIAGESLFFAAVEPPLEQEWRRALALGRLGEPARSWIPARAAHLTSPG